MIPVLLFLIFISTIYYTVHPLFSDKVFSQNEKSNQKEVTRKRQLVNLFKQIRETEYEHDMGIIADEDFERTRDELKEEASSLLENNESKLQLINCEKCDAPTDPNDKFCGSYGEDLCKKNCSNCNLKLNEGHKFCSQCGNKV